MTQNLDFWNFCHLQLERRTKNSTDSKKIFVNLAKFSKIINEKRKSYGQTRNLGRSLS